MFTLVAFEKSFNVYIFGIRVWFCHEIMFWTSSLWLLPGGTAV